MTALVLVSLGASKAIAAVGDAHYERSKSNRNPLKGLWRGSPETNPC